MGLTAAPPGHGHTQDAGLFTLDPDRNEEHSLSRQQIKSLSSHIDPEIIKDPNDQDLLQIGRAASLPPREMLERHKQAFEQRLQQAHQSQEPPAESEASNAGPEVSERALPGQPNSPAMRPDATGSESNRRRISRLFQKLKHAAAHLRAEARHKLESVSLTEEDEHELMVEQIEYIESHAKSDKQFRKLICEVFGVKPETSD